MDKIVFKNGEAPYFSADNLNKLQDNVEKAIVEAVPTNVLEYEVIEEF